MSSASSQALSSVESVITFETRPTASTLPVLFGPGDAGVAVHGVFHHVDAVVGELGAPHTRGFFRDLDQLAVVQVFELRAQLLAGRAGVDAADGIGHDLLVRADGPGVIEGEQYGPTHPLAAHLLMVNHSFWPLAVGGFLCLTRARLYCVLST